MDDKKIYNVVRVICGLILSITGLFLVGFINNFKDEMSNVGIMFVFTLALFQFLFVITVFKAKHEKVQ